jgi:hypothetical protein
MSLLALHDVGRKALRQLSLPSPWMFSSSDKDKSEDDDVCRTCLQGGHLQLENSILSRKIRRSSFRMAGCVGNSQP